MPADLEHQKTLASYLKDDEVEKLGLPKVFTLIKAPASRDAIANLKREHLAFIDEFTEGAGKIWDDQTLTTRTAALEKQFADAKETPATKADARRSKALSILHSQFKRDAAMLQRRKAFFRTTFASDLKSQVSENYDLALKGEDLRS